MRISGKISRILGVEEGDAMLPDRAADTLHNRGNHVDLEPSEHAGRRNLRRKGQKRDAR